MKRPLVMPGLEDSSGWIVKRVHAYVHIEFPILYPELVVHTNSNVGGLSRMR